MDGQIDGSYLEEVQLPQYMIDVWSTEFFGGNVFLELKGWRGIALAIRRIIVEFLGAIHIRCIAI